MGFWAFIAVCAVIGVLISIGNSAALKAAQNAYEAALDALSKDPGNNERRIAALGAGRHYIDLARKAAGNKGIAVFDELRLQNDLSARLGTGATANNSASGDRVAKLMQLSELRDKGVLSDNEFDTEKRKLLAS